jgi:flagellar protein FliO/FliZ
MIVRLTVLFLLCPGLAWAGAESGGVALWPAALKMLGGLVLILGFLLLAYAAARRGKLPLSPAKQGHIRVLETKHLGARKSLWLVSVRNRELLLGVGQDRVELLARLDGNESGSFEEAVRTQARET